LFSFIKLKVVENCILLGYYAASKSNFLQTFQDDLSVPSSGFKNPKGKIVIFRVKSLLKSPSVDPVLNMTHDCTLIQPKNEHQILEDASNQEILHGDFIILGYNCNSEGIKTLSHLIVVITKFRIISYHRTLNASWSL